MIRRALLVLTAALALAAPAHAATATFSDSTLYVFGVAGGEAITVTQPGADVIVTAPGLNADPDGLGANPTCSLVEPGKARCADAQVDAVIVNGGGDADTITLDRASPDADTQTVHGNGGGDALASTALHTAGATTLDGGAGDDTLTKGAEGVTLAGGADQDHLIATTATGEDADDAPSLSADDSGEAGNDVLTGNPTGYNDFAAEAGADTYVGSPLAPSFDISGGTRPPGADTIDYSSRDQPVTVDLTAPGGDGAAGENDDVDGTIDVIYGGSGGDAITCAARRCEVSGGGGADTLTGGTGDDELGGDDGSDRLAGAGGDDSLTDGDFTPADPTDPAPDPGDDALDGGPGDDDLYVDRGADDIHGGDGYDILLAEAPCGFICIAPDPIATTISLDDVANDGPTGAAGDNAHSDLEELHTGGADDVVTGSGHADVLITEGGNDTVDGGGGADAIEAGAGDDTVAAQDGVTDRVDCGAGADAVTADLAGEQPDRADVLVSCETVGGTPFGPLGVAAPPADTAGPAVTLTAKTVKARAFRKTGVLAVNVTCDEACAVAGEAFTTTAKLAVVGELSVASATLGQGSGRRTLRLKLRKAFRRAAARKLRTRRQRRKGLRFSVAVTATDAAGNLTHARKRVRVRG